MKRIFHSTLIMIATIILSACAKETLQPKNEMIIPRDRIGDFLITTREGDDVVYITNLHCPFDGTTETCERPVGTKLNVSEGFYPGPGKAPFDQA